MPDNQLRVLIADDSISFRALLVRIFGGMQGVEVVGTAYTGRAAIDKAAALMPDLIILDIDMRDLSGAQLLQGLKAAAPESLVIINTSLSAGSVDLAMNTPGIRAAELIERPSDPDEEAGRIELSRRLKSIVQLIRARKHESTSIEDRDSPALQRKPEKAEPERAGGREPDADDAPSQSGRKEAVAIAISTGGPAALNILVPSIPGTLKSPIFIVQHMPPGFTAMLANSLNKRSPLHVKEAESGEPVRPGMIYFAPGGRQMKVELHPVSRERVITITDAPPENFCRPSADYLFRSLAPVYGDKVLAIIMTGMGRDGVSGLSVLKKVNAHVIAQNETSSLVFGMAKIAIDAGLVDEVLPLGRIAGAIAVHARHGWGKA
jgi:two-component system chemotaxis response regulator CheB